MHWVKLASRYYLDAALVNAGEAAEVLFTRAMAWCGDEENGGVVPKAILPRLTPTKGAARARALVREGLWVEIPGGWMFASWAKHQTSRDQIDQARESGRVRQARHRAVRNAVSNAVTNAVTNGQVTGTEVEVEVEDAAAAASATDLPPPLQILRAKLDAAKLTVRWDKLDPAMVDRMVDLQALHGDPPLVKAALAAYRPDSPAQYAQAWLSHWEAIPEPGRLRAVDEPACTQPGHNGTLSRCTECASERLAEGTR